MLAVLYFCIFMLVCTYIMIQLVIGIVLDGIQIQSFLDEMDVGQVRDRKKEKRKRKRQGRRRANAYVLAQDCAAWCTDAVYIKHT